MDVVILIFVLYVDWNICILISQQFKQNCPAGLGKVLGYGTEGLELHIEARKRKTPLQLIFNNPRSSFKPGSAADLKLLKPNVSML